MISKFNVQFCATDINSESYALALARGVLFRVAIPFGAGNPGIATPGNMLPSPFFHIAAGKGESYFAKAEVAVKIPLYGGDSGFFGGGDGFVDMF
jgi:hypothetical protein